MRHLSAGGRLLSLMCAVKTEDDCFRYTNASCAQYRCLHRSIFFRYRYRIDTGGIGRYRVPDAGIGLTLSYTVYTDVNLLLEMSKVVEQPE